jgi:hypothetical protein
MSNKQPFALPLTPLQQKILEVVREEPGRFSRSELAKLLVGSKSARLASLSEHPHYGRLAGHGRKAITFEIDIFIQQNYLALEGGQKLVPPSTG